MIWKDEIILLRPNRISFILVCPLHYRRCYIDLWFLSFLNFPSKFPTRLKSFCLNFTRKKWLKMVRNEFFYQSICYYRIRNTHRHTQCGFTNNLLILRHVSKCLDFKVRQGKEKSEKSVVNTTKSDWYVPEKQQKVFIFPFHIQFDTTDNFNAI